MRPNRIIRLFFMLVFRLPFYTNHVNFTSMSYWENNLKLLSEYEPELARIVSIHTPDSVWHTELTLKEGVYTLYEQTPSGKKYIHDLKDPLKQDSDSVESFFKEHLQATDLLVLGPGLGYSLLALMERDVEVGFVVEKSMTVFYHAMKTVDLSPVLKRKIPFFVSSDLSLLKDFLYPVSRKLFGSKPVMFPFPPSTAKDPWYMEAGKIIAEEVMEVSEILFFMNYYTTQLEENTADNFGRYLKAPGVSALKGAFKNQPALLVAGGPSLNSEAIEKIRKFCDSFLVICVDTSYKLLLKNGIVPHLVVTNDPGKENYERHLKGVRGGSYYVGVPTIIPDSFEGFENRIFMSDSASNGFQQWSASLYGGEKGIILSSTNSGCFGLNTAAYLGCDPVVMIGVDLLGDAPEKNSSGGQKSSFPEKNSFMVRDVLGRERRTSRLWHLYYRDFENIIRQNSHMHFIQASSEGIELKNAESIPFSRLEEKDFQAASDRWKVLKEKCVSENREPEPLKELFEDYLNRVEEKCRMFKKEPDQSFLHQIRKSEKDTQFTGLIVLFLQNEFVRLSSFMDTHASSGKFPYADYSHHIQRIYTKLELIQTLLKKMIQGMKKKEGCREDI